MIASSPRAFRKLPFPTYLTPEGLLLEAESLGYKTSWTMIYAGFLLGYFEISDINNFATESIERSTEKQLPAIACLTSSSMSKDEAIGYLWELQDIESGNLELDTRKWLVLELQYVLNRGEVVLAQTDLLEEDDPRVVAVFTDLLHIKTLLETERDQEPIWVPHLLGWGLTLCLRDRVNDFRLWLSKERAWIAVQESERGL